tara:strand:- start:257 stop:2635 length:2379 start_codon:yes stop_codon:yes gene_type:complete
MLSFDSGLSDSLKLGNTTAFWVLKLYYADESATDFIGVSDTHRVDGSDIYYGLVKSWGSFSQSADLFNFTASEYSLSVTLINTKNSIQGQRFSDLFSSNNFANRKWELFLNTNSVSTFDTADRLIGTGFISGDLQYNYDSVKIDLLDSFGNKHTRIPKNIVDSSTYGNAPEENINKPIPIFYGDCSADENAVATGTAGNFDHYFTKGKFPAIVTDVWNSSEAQTFAKPDSVVLNALSADNVYMYKDGYYMQKNSADVSTSSARVDFSGIQYSVYLPFTAHNDTSNVTNWANVVDGDLSTSGTITNATANDAKTAKLRSPIFNIEDFGTLVLNGMKIIVFYSGFNPDSDSAVGSFTFKNASDVSGTLTFRNGADSYAERVQVATDFLGTSGNELRFVLDLNSATQTHTVDIRQVGMEITFTLTDQVFTKDIVDMYEVLESPHIDYGADQFRWDRDFVAPAPVIKKISNTRSISTPEVGQYVYVSGKGREYGAWIDDISGGTDNRNSNNGSASDPNYTEGALIENPVYIIEDILRTEVGLDSSTTGIDIDLESFDLAGTNPSSHPSSASTGTIAYALDDSIADIKFAFSQQKFINSKDLISKVSKQCLSFVFSSTIGKFKIKPLRVPAKYTSDFSFSANKTINFKDIVLKGISQTPLTNVRNQIIVNYAYDYARDKFMKQTSSSADSTSTGSGASGYNQTFKLELDANCILDKTTAEAVQNAYLAHFKDRKIVLDFDISTPKYNALEITDYIDFSNWDSDLKLYGTAYNDDVFIITKISKRVNGCSITAIKVDS